MAETSTNVPSAGSIPVDGVSVTVTPVALTAGQSIRQGMAIGDGAGGLTFAGVDTTMKAMRVNGRPVEALGFYSAAITTGTYAGLAANTPLVAFRWIDATRFCLLQRISLTVASTAPATTAAITERQIIVARSWTVSDTAGTALVLTGNNQKRRTSQGTSLGPDIRAAGPLTAGTRTLDANPIGTAVGWASITPTTQMAIPQYDILPLQSDQEHPLVLAQNEGVVIRIGVVMPTGVTQQTFVNFWWAECAAY